MSTIAIHPWINIKNWIGEYDRGRIVRTALDYFNESPDDINLYARAELTRSLGISLLTNTREEIEEAALQEFIRIPNAAIVIIVLWAEAEKILIEELRSAGKKIGIFFQDDWDWEQARRGYYPESHIPELLALAQSLAGVDEDLEVDYHLAALWLSRAIIPQKVQSQEGNKPLPPDPLPEQTPDIVHTPAEESKEGSGIEQENVEEIEIVPPAPSTRILTISEIEAHVQEQIDLTRQQHARIGLDTQEFIKHVESRDVGSAQAQWLIVKDALESWKTQITDFQIFINSALERLNQELASRPELASLLPRDGGEMRADRVLDMLERIHEYDAQRSIALDQLHSSYISLSTIQADLETWLKSTLEETKPHFNLPVDLTSLSMVEIQQVIQQVKNEREQIQHQRDELRNLCSSRISTTIQRLVELDAPNDQAVFEELTLFNLQHLDIAGLPSLRMIALEGVLNECINEQIIQTKQSVSNQLANSLIESWDDQSLSLLLENLAIQNRDAEAVLLLLSANQVYTRQSPLCLSPKLTQSLLGGISQFVDQGDPFATAGTIGPFVFRDVRIDDADAKAELCLIFMAAHKLSKFSLPDGYLWQQIALEWPREDLPAWKSLWESIINETNLPIVLEERDFDSDLKKASMHAKEMMAHDHGLYTRAASARKSTRHMGLVNNTLLPELQKKLDTLNDFSILINDPELNIFPKENEREEFLERVCEVVCREQRQMRHKEIYAKDEKELEEKRRSDEKRKLVAILKGDPETRVNWLLNKLIEYVDFAIEIFSDEGEITKFYEREAQEQGIEDPDPFHRRNVIGILQDCTGAIVYYADALVAFTENQSRNVEVIHYKDLANELTRLGNLTPLGQIALENISRDRREQDPWIESDALNVTASMIVQRLLTKDIYSLRLPNLVASLTEYRLTDWENTLLMIVKDLSETLDKTRAAMVLYDKDASTQVLLLTQYIPLELQKNVQRLQSDQERETQSLQDQLTGFGGSYEDLTTDVQFGRWRLVHRELKQRVFHHEEVARQTRQHLQERGRQLYQQLNDLNMRFFEISENLPPDVFEIVHQGINYAQRATRKDVLFPLIERFIEDINYRILHSSWPLDDLKQIVEQWEQAFSGAQVGEISQDLKLENVLSLLDRREMRALGLGADTLVSSSIETRLELLNAWLKVRQLPTIQSAELNINQRNEIYRLYSSFGEMISLNRVKADGKNMEFDAPYIRSYWQLKYPKTASLNKWCVLLCLPGNPPSSKDLSDLENFLSEEDFSGDFVILFIPGCTQKIYKRLRENFQNMGLVIIDENAILRMVLSEAVGSTPVGRIRPMMLDSKGEVVSIFQENLEIDPYTAIFVNREPEIDRISSSGDDYAIYGGRRIGKSSLLHAVKARLDRRGVHAIRFTFQGMSDCTDDGTARSLALQMELETPVSGIADFKLALQRHLDAHNDEYYVLLLDEIDEYINNNPDRHIFIEALRAVSNEYGNRFRVVIAGFMKLYDCLRGGGPYTATSDPWPRMLNDIRPLGNLKPKDAETIVKEGFINILGWSLEDPIKIPQKIMGYTGGHPSFVQYFCQKIQSSVVLRRDRTVRLSDLELVFNDLNPSDSFISHVRRTLEMNLDDPVSKYVVVWLAAYSNDTHTFTWGQVQELARLTPIPIPDQYLKRTLEKLIVTSVIRERAPQLYEYSVTDYPLILKRLGDTANLDNLLENLLKYLGGPDNESSG